MFRIYLVRDRMLSDPDQFNCSATDIKVNLRKMHNITKIYNLWDFLCNIWSILILCKYNIIKHINLTGIYYKGIFHLKHNEMTKIKTKIHREIKKAVEIKITLSWQTTNAKFTFKSLQNKWYFSIPLWNIKTYRILLLSNSSKLILLLSNSSKLILLLSNSSKLIWLTKDLQNI